MQHLLRRKIILFSSLLMGAGFCPGAKAQLRTQLNLPEHDNTRYHFGINLGFNKSHFNFNQHPSYLTQDSVYSIESLNSTGINLAWLVNISLSEHWDFRTYPLNLTFSEKAFQYHLKYPDQIGGESPLTIKKVQSIALSLPVQLKFTSDRIGNLKVYTLAGFKFDYDLSSNDGKKNTEDIIVLKQTDYIIEGGIGFHFYFPYFVLSPELKVSWGLTDLHRRNADLKFSSNVDQIFSRMITFSLTVE